MIITALISGTLVLAMFAIGIKKHTEVLAESFYELPPPLTPEEQKILEELAMKESSAIETNKAYNSTNAFKETMRNFKSVNSNDFDKNSKQTKAESVETLDEVADDEHAPTTEDYALNDDELSSYSKINHLLSMQSSEKRHSSKSNGNNATDKIVNNSSLNTNSSVSYSLVDRKDKFLPPPVYLCEESGKIVINITVNNSGEVIDAYVNSASTSKNACLIESALQYANNARFSHDASKTKQVGSITYYFKGKN